MFLQSCVFHRIAWFGLETINTKYKFYILINTSVAFECVCPLKGKVSMFDDKKIQVDF